MTNKYDYAVFIGRLQPPHNAHIKIIETALERANEIIIVLGSHRAAPDVRNPWTTAEREEMTRLCFNAESNSRLHFVAVRDHLYNDTNWMTEVHQRVMQITGRNKKIVLLGFKKDRTSRYLDFFPQWDRIHTQCITPVMSATDIRDQFFEEGQFHPWHDKDWQFSVHENVYAWLTTFKTTEKYEQLHKSFLFLKEYKEKWATAPFQPVFVTTDAVVIASGHVLLVRRKMNPGINLLALPGGFLKQESLLIQSMLACLREETKIVYAQETLLAHIKDSKVFDHQDRSLRGRTITHAFLIKLPDQGELPEVSAGPDTRNAFWMPLGDIHLHDDEFFEDHTQIIQYFTESKW